MVAFPLFGSMLAAIARKLIGIIFDMRRVFLFILVFVGAFLCYSLYVRREARPTTEQSANQIRNHMEPRGQSSSRIYAYRPAAKSPGNFFDLTMWNLQLPLLDIEKGEGVLTIRPPELHKYSSKYFYADKRDKGMIFWTPETGPHTRGSSFPRCELREIKEWTFKGRNLLTSTIQVLQEPANGKVVLAQIHGISGSCTVMEKLTWLWGTVFADQHDQECKLIRHAVGNYSIGEKIRYSIEMVDTVLTVTTDKGSFTHDYPWFNSSVPIYFKTGSYLQSYGNNTRIGGRTKITALNVKHS